MHYDLSLSTSHSQRPPRNSVPPVPWSLHICDAVERLSHRLHPTPGWLLWDHLAKQIRIESIYSSSYRIPSQVKIRVAVEVLRIKLFHEPIPAK